MNKMGETGLEAQQAATEPVLTPEMIEEAKLLLALQREDKGVGTYISLADDREVLARAVRKARPELAVKHAPYEPMP